MKRKTLKWLVRNTEQLAMDDGVVYFIDKTGNEIASLVSVDGGMIIQHLILTDANGNGFKEHVK